MRFGPLPLAEAEGAILAHSLGEGAGRVKKGTRLGPAEIAALAAQGIAEVTAARLEPGDVDEDAAAAALAAAVVPDEAAAGIRRGPAFTGRVNLHATAAGVLAVDAAAVHALNRVDPAITLATLAPLARVGPGELVGTVKIIAYAVPGAALAAAAAAGRGALAVRPVVRRSAGLVLTEVAGQDPKLSAKGRRVTEARLARLGIRLAEVRIVPHRTEAVAEAVAGIAGEIVLILTGSATSDLHDVAPEAVRRAGGEVLRFGMPVDPGNLLFLARDRAGAPTGARAGDGAGDGAGERAGDGAGEPTGRGARPILGLPGCARSPALNGADWVLERLACGLEVGAEDIAAMGVGGLLKEIPSRPQPRERPALHPGAAAEPGEGG